MKSTRRSFLVLAFMVAGCATRPYVLPVADGAGGRPTSPPSLEGRISRIDTDAIAVAPSDPRAEDASVAVRLADTTQLFTVYGGHIVKGELAVGQRVRVWLDRPGPPRADGTSTAAVVLLASLEPTDDWP